METAVAIHIDGGGDAVLLDGGEDGREGGEDIIEGGEVGGLPGSETAGNGGHGGCYLGEVALVEGSIGAHGRATAVFVEGDDFADKVGARHHHGSGGLATDNHLRALFGHEGGLAIDHSGDGVLDKASG